MSRIVLLIIAILLPAIVAAQPVKGLYFGAQTGVNFSEYLQASHGLTSVDTNPGPLGIVNLGWGFGYGLRAEIEGSYRSNGVSGISTLRQNGIRLPLGNPGGSVGTAAIMANVVYEIPLQFSGLALQPYVGAGLGYGWLQFNGAGGNGFGTLMAPGNNTFNGPDTVSFGSAGAFAFQAMVGVSLPLPFFPGLDGTLEYRFFGTAGADVPVNRLAANTTNLINGVVPSSHTRNSFQVLDHALLIGVRYRFGAP